MKIPGSHTKAMSHGCPAPRDAAATTNTYTAVVARFTHEGWDARDMKAAFLQASLLSYQACYISAREELFEQVLLLGTDGQPQYTSTLPATYTHNCPWNDWTPPSESRRRHAAAAAAGAGGTRARMRVRVRVCLAPDSWERGDKVVVAFVSVEVDATGARELMLRRGSETLAVLPLANIHVGQDAARPWIVSLSAGKLVLYLLLEDTGRLNTLLALTQPVEAPCGM